MNDLGIRVLAEDTLAAADRERRSKTGPILDARDPISIARTLVGTDFTNMRGEQRLRRHRGSFYEWIGTHYAVRDDETIGADVWQFLECAKRRGENGTTAPFKPTSSTVANIVEALAAVTTLDSRIEPPAWLADEDIMEPATEYVAVANGLLHLPTQTLIDSRPSYFGLGSSDVEFDEDGLEPQHWHRFLFDIFGNDRQAIETLQCWMGYCLAADTRQQKILLIVGPKRSGKGTLARVITAMIGRDNVAAPTLAALSSNFGLEPLIGRQLAIISDARLGGRTDQAALSERLLSISGEDSLTIDRKFRVAWTGRLTTRFMLLTNELPRLTDASGALTGRFIVLNLENSFYGREDPGLTDRLLTELPGILRWALDGYRWLSERGYFRQPDSARETIEALETLSSPITAFVRDRCHLQAGASVPVSDLYSAWRDWCAANGRREPGTIQIFARDLSAAYPAIRKSRPREGEARFRAYEGIELL